MNECSILANMKDLENTLKQTLQGRKQCIAERFVVVCALDSMLEVKLNDSLSFVASNTK